MKKHPAALMLLLALSACNLYPSRPPQPALHDFGPAPAATNASISVDAPPWLRDERIRYRMLHADPTQIRFYTLDAWLAPPTILLAQRLSAAAVNHSQETAASGPLAPRERAGVRESVKLNLIEFEQVFESPASAHSILSFRASVTDANGKPAAERLFQYRQPCPSPDAKGAVAAYAIAVEQAAAQLQAWLKNQP